MTEEETQLLILRNKRMVLKALHEFDHDALKIMQANVEKSAEELKKLDREIKDLQDQIDAEASGHPEEVLG